MSETIILEPVMNVEIVVPEEYLSSVMSDLSRRRAVIKTVGVRGLCKVIILYMKCYTFWVFLEKSNEFQKELLKMFLLESLSLW